MSERSRNGTEPPKDLLAVFQRTRELNGRLTALEEKNLDNRIAELAVVVEKLAEKPESKGSGVWNWAAMTPPQQLSAWEYLLGWMETILKARYPYAYTQLRLTRCWHEHPDAVEELTSLCTTWLWAYQDPESGPVRVAEWLDRWLPACVRHVSKILGECETGHQELMRHGDPGLSSDSLDAHVQSLRDKVAHQGG